MLLLLCLFILAYSQTCQIGEEFVSCVNGVGCCTGADRKQYFVECSNGKPPLIDVSDECPFGCVGGGLGGGGCLDECEKGAICTDLSGSPYCCDLNTLVECDGGILTNSEYCPAGCSHGSCNSSPCDRGTSCSVGQTSFCCDQNTLALCGKTGVIDSIGECVKGCNNTGLLYPHSCFKPGVCEKDADCESYGKFCCDSNTLAICTSLKVEDGTTSCPHGCNDKAQPPECRLDPQDPCLEGAVCTEIGSFCCDEQTFATCTGGFVEPDSPQPCSYGCGENGCLTEDPCAENSDCNDDGLFCCDSTHLATCSGKQVESGAVECDRGCDDDVTPECKPIDGCNDDDECTSDKCCGANLAKCVEKKVVITTCTEGCKDDKCVDSKPHRSVFGLFENDWVVIAGGAGLLIVLMLLVFGVCCVCFICKRKRKKSLLNELKDDLIEMDTIKEE